MSCPLYPANSADDALCAHDFPERTRREGPLLSRAQLAPAGPARIPPRGREREAPCAAGSCSARGRRSRRDSESLYGTGALRRRGPPPHARSRRLGARAVVAGSPPARRVPLECPEWHSCGKRGRSGPIPARFRLGRRARCPGRAGRAASTGRRAPLPAFIAHAAGDPGRAGGSGPARCADSGRDGGRCVRERRADDLI